MTDYPMLPFDPPERWLPVPGYEGRYDVSDLGRVRSRKKDRRTASRGGVLKPGLNGAGYLIVVLYRGRERWTVAIHRLVLLAFVGPCPDGQEVRHGPNGRLDNRLSQLRYGTPCENYEDQRRDGTARRGGQYAHAKLTDQIVLACRNRAAAGETSKSLAAEFGVAASTIQRIIRGQKWSYLPGAISSRVSGPRN